MTDLSQSVSGAQISSLPVDSAQPAINTQAIEGIEPVATPGSSTLSTQNSPEPVPMTLPSTFSPPAITTPADIGSVPTTPILTTTPADTPAPILSPTTTLTPPATQEIIQPLTSAPKPIPAALPNINEMEQLLRQDVTLLPGIEVQEVAQKVDRSPLAALQPNQVNQETTSGITSIDTPKPEIAPQLSHFELATTAQAIPKTPELKEHEDPLLSFPLSVFMIGILGVQILLAFIQSLYFMIVQYPKLESALMMQNITQLQMTLHFIKLGVLGVFALGSLAILVMALLQLNKPTHKIIIIIGLSLCVFNVFVQTIFVKPELVAGNPFTIPRLLQEMAVPPAVSTSY
jgi:hypothetical protein